MTIQRFIKASALSVFAVTTIANAMEVDPRVTKLLRSNAGDISVVVNLQGQYDLTQIPEMKDPAARAKAVTSALENFQKKSAEKIVSYLQNGKRTGLREVAPIWLTNSIRVRGTSNVIGQLTKMNAGIESILLDAPKAVDGMDSFNSDDTPTTPTTRAPISWGVEKVGAPKLWAQGINGKGILTAMIDSGATIKHPDLAPVIWKNPGETGTDANDKDKATNGIDDDSNGYIDDVVGWNFEDKSNNPQDNGGHGSQTAGIVAGFGTNGTKTGVAPGAKLMILRSCCSTGTAVFESNTWEAMQYAIKNGARVISMSLSVKPFSNPTYAKWRRASEVMLAAGVVHVNSAGNLGSGSEPTNMGAPASNPPAWFHPKQPYTGTPTSMITIGATDQKDKLRDYSSTGPVTWESIPEYKDFPYEKGEKGGLIKPDVCGPSEVPSTSIDGKSYTKSFGGTSSATPNVAGVVTLLLSAKPTLTVAQVIETLQTTAVPIESVFNNKCGAGRVDAVAAVEYAKSKF